MHSTSEKPLANFYRPTLLTLIIPQSDCHSHPPLLKPQTTASRAKRRPLARAFPLLSSPNQSHDLFLKGRSPPHLLHRPHHRRIHQLCGLHDRHRRSAEDVQEDGEEEHQFRQGRHEDRGQGSPERELRRPDAEV